MNTKPDWRIGVANRNRFLLLCAGVLVIAAQLSLLFPSAFQQLSVFANPTESASSGRPAKATPADSQAAHHDSASERTAGESSPPAQIDLARLQQQAPSMRVLERPPPRAICMSSTTECKCVSLRGERLILDDAQCRSIALNGGMSSR